MGQAFSYSLTRGGAVPRNLLLMLSSFDAKILKCTSALACSSVKQLLAERTRALRSCFWSRRHFYPPLMPSDLGLMPDKHVASVKKATGSSWEEDLGIWARICLLMIDGMMIYVEDSTTRLVSALRAVARVFVCNPPPSIVCRITPLNAWPVQL